MGDGAVIGKGVCIGQNSIVGAGAIVVKDIPPNSIAAGNPAKVIKYLDLDTKMITRAQFFQNPEKLFKDFDTFDRAILGKNSLRHWLRHMLMPRENE